MRFPRTAAGQTIATLTLLVAVAGCSSESDYVATINDVGHIHELVEGEDGLLIATHSGLFNVEEIDTAVLVGEGRHDLMALAIATDGSLVASGHPDLRDPDWQRDGKPPHMGLARSVDGGVDWQQSNLVGEADFHAIVPLAEGGYIAAESSGSIMSSPNGIDWETLAELELRDLAMDPTSPLHLLGTTYVNELHESVDGGVTWSLVKEAPPVALLQWNDSSIVVADPGGTLLTATSPAGPWTNRSAVGAEPEALLVRDNGVWVALEGGSVVFATGTDGPFTPIYSAPPADD